MEALLSPQESFVLFSEGTPELDSGSIARLGSPRLWLRKSLLPDLSVLSLHFIQGRPKPREGKELTPGHTAHQGKAGTSFFKI